MTESLVSDRMEGLTTPVPSGILSQLPVRLTPHRSLLTYYVLSSLLLGPGFIFMLVPLFFRFVTLQYDIDEEGIRMRWGILFRREITLTYARIQDIHLSSNFVERWLGLGKIQIQTASGNASAEMKIEGIREFDSLRDFLYTRMRGAREGHVGRLNGQTPSLRADEELVAALAATATEMRAIRELIERRLGPGDRTP